jgi:hypothetical protein
MASTELLVAGLVTEVGVLQYEQLAGSDHRAYFIELDLDTAPHLGAEWKVKPGRSDMLPRLPLQKQEVVALFQRTLVNKWKKNKVQQAQEAA